MKTKKGLTKNNNESDRELLTKFNEIREHIYSLSRRVDELSVMYEYPYIVKEIKNEIKKGTIKKVTTAWIQKKYKFGYARSTILIEKMKENEDI